MDFFQIINDIAKVDPEVYDRFDTRRAAFRNFIGFGKKVSASALPLAVSTLFSKAYGQSTSGASGLPTDVIATLKLAYQLEHLEFFYYDTALNSGSLLTAEQRAAFTIIRNDEQLHINTLKAALKDDSGPAPTRASFDYTGSQTGRTSVKFPSLGATFTNQAEFLLVAQNFVDTGVRAYKGGAPSLNTNTTKDILEVALNIHSVEARHSARIRSFRRNGIQGTGAPKSWITPDETTSSAPLPNGGFPGAPATVGPYIAGSDTAKFPAENNTNQGLTPINVQTLAPTGGSATAGAEAFDEPLDAPTVKAIAKNFAADPAALFN